MPTFRPALLTAFFTAMFLGVPASRAQRERMPYDDLLIVEQRWPNAKKTTTSIRYIIETPGQGQQANPGDIVSVLYEGKLLNGKIFDRNQNRLNPFRFRLSRGVVIPGWDEIVEQMKAGEKRLVVIPPELAYGARGEAPNIPRDATLVFQIEVLKIERSN